MMYAQPAQSPAQPMYVQPIQAQPVYTQQAQVPVQQQQVTAQPYYPQQPAAQPIYAQPVQQQVPQPAPVQQQQFPQPASVQQQFPQPAPVQQQRTPEQQRSGLSTFTDKIRAVIYPSSRTTNSPSMVGETPFPIPNQQVGQQSFQQYQAGENGQRYRAEAPYSTGSNQTAQNRDNGTYQTQASAINTGGSGVNATPNYTNPAESSLDRLSRMLLESQTQSSNGKLNLEAQEIEQFKEQILQAARMDEAYQRGNRPAARAEEATNGMQLRPSPIQDKPYEREPQIQKNGTGNYDEGQGQRNGSSSFPSPQMQRTVNANPSFSSPTTAAYAGSNGNYTQQQMSGSMPAIDVQEYMQSEPSGSIPVVDNQPSTTSNPGESRFSTAFNAQLRSMQDLLAQAAVAQEARTSASGQLSGESDPSSTLVSTLARRADVKTSDDTLLDIVKSLPPMGTPPQTPDVQLPVLNGRATRTLGSVLLDGHLVPEERLQVAQHVQRMLRGVDLNYQLGEILLMFKLLSPDQLLAASLVSYDMISTNQISSLGRIRQELHAMGLEYDLESLLILFRMLSPEQMREVRANWAS
jgi:hypothetical protein